MQTIKQDLRMHPHTRELDLSVNVMLNYLGSFKGSTTFYVSM